MVLLLLQPQVLLLRLLLLPLLQAYPPPGLRVTPSRRWPSVCSTTFTLEDAEEGIKTHSRSFMTHSRPFMTHSRSFMSHDS